MRGGSLVLTITVAVLAATVMTDPAAGQTVTSISPPVVGQAIGRAVGRISFSGTFDLNKTILDGGALTIDSGTYGRGTRTYEFDVPGAPNYAAGVTTPNAIAVVPASPKSSDAAAKLAEVINDDPTTPFWAVAYFGFADVGNGWVSFVWKYEDEWRLTAGGGLSLTEVADPGGDFSASNFSTTNQVTLGTFLQLRGTGLTALNNTTSVKLRHDVLTGELYSATLTVKQAEAATAMVPLSTGIGTASPPVFPSLGDYDLEINGSVVIDKAVKLVENIIDDPSFHQGPSGGSIALNWNAEDFDLGPFWLKSKLAPSPDGLRKGSVRKQLSARQYPFATGAPAVNNTGDIPHASLKWNTTGDGVHRIWQTVYRDFAAGTPLMLTGLWAGESDHYPMTYGAQIRSGGPDGTIIAETPPGQQMITPFDWDEFAVGGVIPADTTQLTVVFYGDQPTTSSKALHIDDLLLRVATDHPTPPSITGMTTPNYAVTGATSVTIRLTGTDLTSGQTSVKLQEPGVILTGPSWLDAVKNLTKQGAFALYQWRSGDKVVLTGGAGVILGEYDIAEKYNDDTIVLTADINGAGGDITGSTITGWVRKPVLAADSVSASGTQVTATFDLTGAPVGYRNIIVEVGTSLPVVWRDGFSVVQAGPALTNGSFELPEAASGCGASSRSETRIPATDWNVRFWNGYMNAPTGIPILAFRDDQWQDGGYDLPTCPPAELGLHYGSTATYNGTGTAQYSQTVTAEAGKTYTLSGFFGHSPLNRVSLSLLDGNSAAAPMTGASVEVLPAGSFQDWTFAHVTGTASGGIITAAWEVENQGANGPRVAWTDHLVLSECTQPVSVASVDPYAVANDTVGPITLTITGSGFTGTPEVYLTRIGQTIVATDIAVLSDTELTCEVSGLPTPDTQAFEVVVRNNGCLDSLPEGFVSAQTAILNEQFEEPSATLECDPRKPKTDPVSYWHFADELIREGDVYMPAECPLLSCNCPEPAEGCAGGHYASMSTGEGEEERAWQTLKVAPGNKCTFGGWFSWGGAGTVNLKLVDGYGPNGTVLATAPVPQTNEWCYSAVEGYAAGHLVTVVWELVGTVNGSPSAVHADYMTFASTSCHAAFADVDNDGDVDQEDFAVFQVCYTGAQTGSIPEQPAYCGCLDVHPLGAPDGFIDTGDLTLFEICASGPGVPATAGCGVQ